MVFERGERYLKDSLFFSWLHLFRFKQWIKNVLVFLILLFSIQFVGYSLAQDLIVPSISKLFIIFCAFNLLCSGIYIINDLFDQERDRFHPEKMFRPIHTGDISPKHASYMSIILILAALIIGFTVSYSTGKVLFLYFIISFLYSAGLKDIAILDIVIVSTGYGFRVAAGQSVLNFSIHFEIYLFTILVAVFVSVAKRRAEIIAIGQKANLHRRSLGFYSVKGIDKSILILVPAICFTYILYLLKVPNFNIYIPFSYLIFLFAVIRYLYLTYSSSIVGSPEEVVYKDFALTGLVSMWIIFVLISGIY